jgi:hypothetical protein
MLGATAIPRNVVRSDTVTPPRKALSMSSPASASVQALGLTTFRGLPAHILIVHVVVVFVPLSSVALIAALRPSWARRMSLVLPGLAIVAFLSVLAAMNAGGWLQNHVQNTALVRDHTRIAGQLWPFSAAVAILSVVVWWLHGRAVPSGGRPRVASSWSAASVVLAVVSVVVAVGAVVQVVRIGESGARASWKGHFSQESLHSGH